MSTSKDKNYKATFILDLRKTEDDAAKVITDISELLGQIGATVGESNDLGVRDFSRAADHRFSQGHYVQIAFSGESSLPKQLQEKLKLEKRVNRVCIESV